MEGAHPWKRLRCKLHWCRIWAEIQNVPSLLWDSGSSYGTSPQSIMPNFKADWLFLWNRCIWKEAWCLNKNFSIDEQTCKMQGKSKYKTWCGKYKRIGDGIQTDCIADDGFTYDFYFRNEPVDTKWWTGACVQCMHGCCTCLRTWNPRPLVQDGQIV